MFRLWTHSSGFSPTSSSVQPTNITGERKSQQNPRVSTACFEDSCIKDEVRRVPSRPPPPRNTPHTRFQTFLRGSNQEPIFTPFALACFSPMIFFYFSFHERSPVTPFVALLRSKISPLVSLFLR